MSVRSYVPFTWDSCELSPHDQSFAGLRCVDMQSRVYFLLASSYLDLVMKLTTVLSLFRDAYSLSSPSWGIKEGIFLSLGLIVSWLSAP